MTGGTDSNSTSQPQDPQGNSFKGTADFSVKVIFSSLAQQNMRDWLEDHQIDTSKKYEFTQLVTRFAWSYPSNNKGFSVGTTERVFVDCSSSYANTFDNSDTFDGELMGFLAFAIDRLEHLINKRIREGGYGTVTVRIIAYHPVEKLLFALATMLNRVLPEAGVYKDFIKKVMDSPRFKNKLDWVYEKNWDFNVPYCCVLEGYKLCVKGKSTDEKVKILKDLVKKIDRAGRITSDPDKIAAWKAGGGGVTKNVRYDDGALFTSSNDVEFTVEYLGKQLTKSGLTTEIAKLTNPQPHELNAQADQLQAKLDEDKKNLYNPKKQEINDKIDELHLQQYPGSANYNEWHEVEEKERQTAFENNNITWGNTPLHDHHSIDEIEFDGKFVKEWELEHALKNITKTEQLRQKEIDDLREAAKNIAKKIQMQMDLSISILFAIGGIFWAPIAIGDIVFEVYKWQRDKLEGDQLIRDHGLGVAFDVVGLVPYFGGFFKAARNAKAASQLKKIDKLAGSMDEVMSNADNAITSVDNLFSPSEKKTLNELEKIDNLSNAMDQTMKNADNVLASVDKTIAKGAVDEIVAAQSQYAKAAADYSTALDKLGKATSTAEQNAALQELADAFSRQMEAGLSATKTGEEIAELSKHYNEFLKVLEETKKSGNVEMLKELGETIFPKVKNALDIVDKGVDFAGKSYAVMEGIGHNGFLLVTNDMSSEQSPSINQVDNDTPNGVIIDSESETYAIRDNLNASFPDATSIDVDSFETGRFEDGDLANDLYDYEPDEDFEIPKTEMTDNELNDIIKQADQDATKAKRKERSANSQLADANSNLKTSSEEYDKALKKAIEAGHKTKAAEDEVQDHKDRKKEAEELALEAAEEAAICAAAGDKEGEAFWKDLQKQQEKTAEKERKKIVTAEENAKNAAEQEAKADDKLAEAKANKKKSEEQVAQAQKLKDDAEKAKTDSQNVKDKAQAAIDYGKEQEKAQQRAAQAAANQAKLESDFYSAFDEREKAENRLDKINDDVNRTQNELERLQGEIFIAASSGQVIAATQLQNQANVLSERLDNLKSEQKSAQSAYDKALDNEDKAFAAYGSQSQEEYNAHQAKINRDKAIRDLQSGG